MTTSQLPAISAALAKERVRGEIRLGDPLLEIVEVAFPPIIGILCQRLAEGMTDKELVEWQTDRGRLREYGDLLRQLTMDQLKRDPGLITEITRLWELVTEFLEDKLPSPPIKRTESDLVLDMAITEFWNYLDVIMANLALLVPSGEVPVEVDGTF